VLGGRICRWLLLFWEYDFKVDMKPIKLNAGPDHLSHILSGEDARNIDYRLPDTQLFVFKMVDDYFADIVHFLSIRMAPSYMTVTKKK
jgi:hypothetical protein